MRFLHTVFSPLHISSISSSCHRFVIIHAWRAIGTETRPSAPIYWPAVTQCRVTDRQTDRAASVWVWRRIEGFHPLEMLWTTSLNCCLAMQAIHDVIQWESRPIDRTQKDKSKPFSSYLCLRWNNKKFSRKRREMMAQSGSNSCRAVGTRHRFLADDDANSSGVFVCFSLVLCCVVIAWRAPLAECPREDWIQAWYDGVPVSVWPGTSVPRWSSHPSLWCCSSTSSSTIR